ncbi:uncharacterized protein [Eurosta solidaginis]|uniref:uncharacterized protein n=1 Tax=Eurosta solidaginis TaxID=178769 RepID=UPI00353063D3
MLCNRFNNLNRKRLKTDKLATTTSEVDLKKIDIHPNILCQQNKMRFMSGDENDSMDMWISTHEFRCSDNKAATGLSDVLNRLPFYKQASGVKYTEYDKFNLMNKWERMKEKLNKIYKDNIKDKYYAELFLSLEPSTDESSRDCILIMLLNTVLKPTARNISIVGGKTIINKVTIGYAILSSIVQVKCTNDLQRVQEERVKNSLQRKTTIQPYVIVIGTAIKTLKEFYTCFDKCLLNLGPSSLL